MLPVSREDGKKIKEFTYRLPVLPAIFKLCKKQII
jgi:hypothetical protein